MIEFYKKLLGTDCTAAYVGIDALKPYVNQVLDAEHCRLLASPFSSEDITKSIFSLHSNKAPGPDGFNAFFFQQTWPIVGAGWMRLGQSALLLVSLPPLKGIA